VSSVESEKSKLRILVVRPDRIGDVILSTPVFEALKNGIPDSHLTVMVQENLLPLLNGHPFIDELMIYKKQTEVRKLADEFREKEFQIALALQTNWKLAMAIYLAGIPVRIAPWSKFHSYLFYNKGLRQRRSAVEMHEADYNLQLLENLGITIPRERISTRITISGATVDRANQWLKDKGRDPTKKLILVHPGMGGSARNWPESHYLELIRLLVSEGYQVLITAGPADGNLINRFEGQLKSQGTQALYYQGGNDSQVDFLGALCKNANVVVAPSTGPLHIAVALERPVVTFYPSIRVQSAKRWGPYTEREAEVFSPQAACGKSNQCIQGQCMDLDCMKSISVADAAAQVKNFSQIPISSK
jgi:lipopolysaccharide heptosyltransferase II